MYRQASIISRTIVGNSIADHSDVVGASPVDAAPTTSHSPLNTWLQYNTQRQLQAETRNIQIVVFGAPYIRDFTVNVTPHHVDPSFH